MLAAGTASSSGKVVTRVQVPILYPVRAGYEDGVLGERTGSRSPLPDGAFSQLVRDPSGSQP